MFRDQCRQYYNNNKIKPLKIKKVERWPYFLSRRVLFSYINSSNKEINSFLEGKIRAKVVTGFGLTGYPHVGTKIIRDELFYFLKLKSSVFICLSETDAAHKGVAPGRRSKSLCAISKLFKKVFDDKKCFFVNSQKSERLIKKISWSDAVAREVFQKTFGPLSSNSKEAALFDMAKNILGISSGLEKDKKCFVILGVDELNNAVFITRTAKALKQDVPIFLFNKVVPGYNFLKMGKSVQEKSFVFYSSFRNEYEKAKKYFGKNNHKNSAKCSLCDIVFFSGYEIDLKQKNIIKFIHQNSKSILKNIYKSL